MASLRQAAPFIVLEHLEHCSGTVLNGVNREIPEHIYVSLKHELFLLFGIFTFYIFHFVSKGAVTRGNFFLQLVTQIWVKKVFQAPVEL